MKKYINVCLIFLTLFTFTAYGGNYITRQLEYDGKVHNYSAEEIFIEVDNEPIEEFSTIPVILNNYTLVPARDVFEKMGYTVSWEEKTRKVCVKNTEKEVNIVIDSLVGTKNGETFTLQIPPKIINDYTMIPVRAVAEAVDCEVKWDNATRLISINTKNPSIETQTIAETQTQSTTQSLKGDKISILWDQISNVDGNNTPEKKKSIEGLDVLCPTWFYVSDEQGNITDKGSMEYAQWAKEQGYDLWGLVSNQFSGSLTHTVLGNPQIRQNIINNLITLADKYSLDGINIDFENVQKEDGENYVTFIKEATEKFKANNLTVSVDMYVPTSWTEHYGMQEVGNYVDYVIIMAYDEHYSSSKTAGSVASLPWVDKHMALALEKVPKEKLIMGMPFYTRRWAEETHPDGNVSVTSVSMKMEEAYNLLVEKNAEIVWDEEVGQYYGEYTEGNVRRRIWLEEEKSIEEKLKVMKKYDLSGVACWKRGHEKDSIWDIINKYV